jgi:hypothetical protein
VPRDAFDTELASAREDLGRLVRRLRSLSPASWRDRQAAARAALDGFVALEVQLESAPLTPPMLATHVLPDAIAVVGGDALEAIAATADRSALATARTLLESALAATR